MVLREELSLLNRLRETHQHNHVALLNAHGCDDDNKWKYVDGTNKYPIQDFVNINDN